jgi:hypothetical protein
MSLQKTQDPTTNMANVLFFSVLMVFCIYIDLKSCFQHLTKPHLMIVTFLLNEVTNVKREQSGHNVTFNFKMIWQDIEMLIKP